MTAYVIIGGLFGTERAALNPAPAAIYVAFWVGLSFFTALFGNLWALVNPWKVAWGFAELFTDARLSRLFDTPVHLLQAKGYYQAIPGTA